MALIYWWMPVAWAIAIILVVVLILVFSKRGKRRPDATAIPVAHSERLTALPGYARALDRYRSLLLAGVAGVAVLVLAAVLLSSRLISTTIFQPEMRNRDIVLCLDVSGSMTEYDAAILDTFSELVKKFDGERIGLTVFNASAVTYFPLTNDYNYVEDQMTKLRDNLADPNTDYSYTNGTLLGEGSSLIGDGLGSCVMRFDDLDSKRSRSIILATDNYVAGEQILTLPEAGEYAKESKVKVYGINPGDVSSKDYIEDLAKEMREVVEDTGGAYYALDDPDAIPSIVTSIQKQQTAKLKGAPQLVQNDEPTWPWVTALFATLGIMMLGWRLKR